METEWRWIDAHSMNCRHADLSQSILLPAACSLHLLSEDQLNIKESGGPQNRLLFESEVLGDSLGSGDAYEQGAATAESLQSCLTLCNPIDISTPGSSTHGIFQARVLEWGTMALSNEQGERDVKRKN